MDSSVPKAFIFMKVGDYGDECLEGIIERKNCEWEKQGKMFWGYGGTILHPTVQVKRFVEECKKEGLDCIEVLMERTPSNPKKRDYDGRKKENLKKKYSKDGKNWKPVPPEICTDSNRALVLDEIREYRQKLDLRQFEVGIGKKDGTNATQYLAFRGMKKLTGRKRGADKGCLVAVKPPSRVPKRSKNPVWVEIRYRARLKYPYAVFLK